VKSKLPVEVPMKISYLSASFSRRCCATPPAKAPYFHLLKLLMLSSIIIIIILNENGIYPALKLIKKSIFSIEIALFIQIGYNSLKESPHFGVFTKVRMLSPKFRKLPHMMGCGIH
jgi:hypothetical protein